RIEDTLGSVMLDTAKTTSLVFIILLGAAMLTSAFRAFGGEHLVREFLTTLPGGFWTQFIIVMAVIFLLGFFLDFIEIAVVVVPIVAPILLMDPSANITAVWLGVMIGLNIQTSFLTPPFGFALFYLRGVAPQAVRTTDIYKGVIPFIALQIIALGIVGNLPPLVNYLPSRVSLMSENAPPPVNPLLQSCVEEYLIERYDERGDEIMAAIDRAAGADYSALPEDSREDLEDAFEEARATFEHIAEIKAAQQAVEAAIPGYRPLHEQVRTIERDVRKIGERLEEIGRELDNLRYAEVPEPELEAELRAEIERIEAERERLEASVPEDWEERHRVFEALLREQTNASRAFRRSADDGYEPVQEIAVRLRATDAFAALEDRLRAVPGEFEGTEPEAMDDRLQDLRSAFRDTEAGDDLMDALGDARRP
ncbi:MAG TPA: TRAP transporter large permease subunit, partial [Myxococcota bacterium]|nr:TRAP transporter large permease subunit [Myxococcota bacterium]